MSREQQVEEEVRALQRKFGAGIALAVVIALIVFGEPRLGAFVVLPLYLAGMAYLKYRRLF